MLHHLRDTADKVEYGYTGVAKRGRIEGIEFLFALVRPRLNEGLPKDYDSNRLFSPFVFFLLSFFRSFEQITEERNGFNFVSEIEFPELSGKCEQKIWSWSLGLKMLVYQAVVFVHFTDQTVLGFFSSA